MTLTMPKTLISLLLTLSLTFIPAPHETSCKTYESCHVNWVGRQKEVIDTLTVGNDGLLRDDDGFVAAALGNAFGDVGSRWLFVLRQENGYKLLRVIKADDKGQHTDESGTYGSVCGEIIEFIVDESKMPKEVNGYAYGGNLDKYEAVQGAVVGWIEWKTEVQKN